MVISAVLIVSGCQRDLPNHLLSDLNFRTPSFRSDSLLGVRISDEILLDRKGAGITKDRFVTRYANFRLYNVNGIMSLLLAADTSNTGELRIVRYDLYVDDPRAWVVPLPDSVDIASDERTASYDNYSTLAQALEREFGSPRREEHFGKRILFWGDSVRLSFSPKFHRIHFAMAPQALQMWDELWCNNRFDSSSNISIPPLMADTTVDTSIRNIAQQFIPKGYALPDIRYVKKSLVVAGIPGNVVYTLDSSNAVRVTAWSVELLEGDTINFHRIASILTAQFGEPNFTREMFTTWIRGDSVLGLADDHATLYLISTDTQTFAKRKDLFQLRRN